MSLRHLLVVAFVFVAGLASAQTVSITGRVADPQGAVVSGAVVTLNPSSTAARTTSTTADGTFSFAGVPAGLNVLQVEPPGFERWSRNITVSSAASSFDVTLQLGGVAETVAVDAPWRSCERIRAQRDRRQSFRRVRLDRQREGSSRFRHRRSRPARPTGTAAMTC